MRGALEQIGDEMDLHLIHAAISPIISETNDCAHGIFHPTSGETIAQGRYGLPVFLANMQFTVTNLIALVAKEGGFKPGDMWIVNDPYVSGTHLQDIVLVSPYFVDGELFALLASTGHWMDIGGSVPGGWAPKATEIHQEGLIIPPMKLYDARQAERAAGEDVHRQRAAAGPDRRRPLGDVQRVQCRRGAASTRCSRATAREKLADCITRDDGPLGSADALLHRRDPGRRVQVRGLSSTTTASSTSR